MSICILALETSAEACSVALFHQDQIDTRFEIAIRNHTQRVLPLIQEVLLAQKLQLSSLNALAFCQGPGSFTGVRIGIGFAQGLALGANLPMIGISSLATMAQGAWRKMKVRRVIAAINAYMGEIYWAEYQKNNNDIWLGTETETVLLPEKAQERLAALRGKWAIVGTGWQIYPELLKSSGAKLIHTDILLPSAEDMLPLAINKWEQKKIHAVENIRQTYLRNKDTWKKLPSR
ncbi:tRNA (adenosine(37)-N6)-threonylcarbamoyltransferase complex dimerization subunit type 1 TsaB [Pantoea sp. Aalb]|uniref:tRNA (adenosine(37)-N6)-threonylcarbamoyltransferase complex dimerization subunit type 1 TsaB n=1 Tax=Pantoea sp. Aalb TaxID=2576762 RepID=UPI001320A5B4|nr:tRNA (adenosine(37)-N6)-threonylcarbamoyltransferase complex dimerization subunit type 1 TsaB [Pantoea sp. Aalb]MXP67376.1 tRNA (adenosine(37)-N6)-threonylcarbamoyltransferase complex dimerization subunit type 1 TsaB [Pantoea sp. Aalb]